MTPDKRHATPLVQLLATGWSHAHGGKPLNLVPCRWRMTRLAILTANPSCWHAGPVGRLRRAHAGAGMLTLAGFSGRVAVPRLPSRTVAAGPGHRARDPPLSQARFWVSLP